MRDYKRNSLIKIAACSLFGWTLLIDAGHAASFDCSKASTKVEKMICADAELSKLDEKLARVYKSALAYVIDPATLKIEQGQWLKVRDQASDKKSLLQRYQDRISSVRNWKTMTKNEPHYRYKLEHSEDKVLCPHMTQVFNDKFKTPWYKSWLKLEPDPYLFGVPYSQHFERLPGVAYDKRSTYSMFLSKYPTSPEFDAVKWQEGQIENDPDRKGKELPILITQLDIDNDGEMEWVVKHGFLKNGDNTRVSEQDRLSIYRTDTFNFTEKVQAGAMYYGQNGRARPKTLGTAMQLRPFMFSGKAYIAAYQAKGGSFDQATFEGNPTREYLNIWRLTGKSQRFYNQSTETLDTATVCRIRMYLTKPR